MTTPAHSTLVEKVAKAISQWMNCGKLPHRPWERLQESTRAAYRDQAKTAIEACHATELVEALRQMRREYGVHLTVCGATLVRVDNLLRKVDGEPVGSQEMPAASAELPGKLA